MKLNRTMAALVASLVTSIVLAVPAAAAPVVGPGDPLRIPYPNSPVENNMHMDIALCSAGVPGTLTEKDGKQHRVLLTAGHCVNSKELPKLPVTGDEVFVLTRDQGDVKIGTRGHHEFSVGSDENTINPLKVLNDAFNSGDWAFVDLRDDVNVTNVSFSKDENGNSHGEGVPMEGIVDYKALGPMGVSLDNFGQPVCMDGTRTGRQCGYQIFRLQNGVWAVGLKLVSGDSGGNAYNPKTRQVVGVNSMAVGPFNRFQPVDTAIEKAYGIEDGKVNEHFKVDGAGVERNTEYRTISEDLAKIREFNAKNKEKASVDAVDGGGMKLPALDALIGGGKLSQLAQLPELPSNSQ